MEKQSEIPAERRVSGVNFDVGIEPKRKYSRVICALVTAYLSNMPFRVEAPKPSNMAMHF